MLNTRDIADLRRLLVRARVGDRKAYEQLCRQLGDRAGELLALADASLKIRKVYLRGIPEAGVEPPSTTHGALAASVSIGGVSLFAMRDLDKLEEDFRLAQGTTPLRD